MINRNKVQILIEVDGRSGRAELGRVQDQFGELHSRATTLRGSLLAVGAAFASATLAAKSLFDAGRTVQQLTCSMEAITGSAEAASSELQWLRSTTNELGQEFYTAAESYRGFLAASQDTAIAGQTARDIFRATLEAATALGMSVEDTEGSLRAFTQMVSKGNVQAEELRGQLGERLYGAFNLAAQAMGVSTSELNKMLERGEVLAEDLLPELARVLHEKYGQAALDASHDAQAAFNRFTTAWKDLQVSISDAGFLDFATDTLTMLTDAIKDPEATQSLQEITASMLTMAEVSRDTLLPTLRLVVKLISSLTSAYNQLPDWVKKALLATPTGGGLQNMSELFGTIDQYAQQKEQQGTYVGKIGPETAGYETIYKAPKINLEGFDGAGQTLDEFLAMYDQVQKDLDEKLKKTLQGADKSMEDSGQKELDAFLEMVEEWQESLRDKVNQALGVFDDLHEFFDELDAEEKNVKIDLALEEFFGDLDQMQVQLNERYQRMVDLSQQTAEAMQNAFSDYFFDAMQGRLDSLADYINGFLQAVQRSLASAFAGQLTESITNSKWWSKIFHTGGIIGQDGAGQRSVPASLFIGAPRLHDGLMPDEYPAILQRNEAVLTPAQLKAVSGAGKSVNFRVEVKNETGQNIQATASQPQFDGEQYVSYVWLRAVQNNTNGIADLLRIR